MADTVVQCLSLHSCLLDVMRGYVMVTLLLWERNDYSSVHKLSLCRWANSHRTLFGGALLSPHKVAGVDGPQSCFSAECVSPSEMLLCDQVVFAFLWCPSSLLILTSDPGRRQNIFLHTTAAPLIFSLFGANSLQYSCL